MVNNSDTVSTPGSINSSKEFGTMEEFVVVETPEDDDQGNIPEKLASSKSSPSYSPNSSLSTLDNSQNSQNLQNDDSVNTNTTVTTKELEDKGETILEQLDLQEEESDEFTMKRNRVYKILESDGEFEPVIDEGGLAFLDGKKKRKSSNNKDLLPVNYNEIAHTRTHIASITENISKGNNNDIKFKLDDIGGLDEQIKSVAGAINIQLNYPDFCSKFNIKLSKGFLLHGPPGTGKTSLARALIHEFSTGPKPLAYFQFTSSDILSKNIGESETKLTAIFKAAKSWQPSILFFDEIDGLIPIRNEKDRAAASLVSTFLNLMDGLNNKGELIVIGSTNRITNIDPAMRRQGRFEEEIYFPLPQLSARKDILNKFLSSCEQPTNNNLLSKISELTAGYSGADITSLCTKASFNSIKRKYPELANGDQITEYIMDTVEITEEDFINGMKQIKSTSTKINSSNLNGLLLRNKVNKVKEHLITWRSYLKSTESMRSHLPKVIILKGVNEIPLNYVLDTILFSTDNFRVIELDLYSNLALGDRHGIAGLLRLLRSLKKGEAGLFVIRNLDQFLSDAHDKVITLILQALQTPCHAGKVTFLFSCNQITQKITKLKDLDHCFKLDTDKVANHDLIVFCKQFSNKLISNLKLSEDEINEFIQQTERELFNKLQGHNSDDILKLCSKIQPKDKEELKTLIGKGFKVKEINNNIITFG